jgi:FkbM family methyltransferase
MVFNVHDRYVGRSLELYGEYCEREVEIFRQLVGPGDWVVDVGANVGTHTLFFARQVGPRGRVVAFEPQRIVFQALCANMALNSVANVLCQPFAVGAEPGEIVVPPLDYGRENNFGGLTLGGAEGDRVPVVTLDSLGLPACRLIKIDVEGMERDVLAGATETIARHRPLLYVENDRDERAAELIRFIDGLGYAMYWHQPLLYNPENFLGNQTNVFGRIASRNMFCVPHGAAVCRDFSRWRRARRWRSGRRRAGVGAAPHGAPEGVAYPLHAQTMARRSSWIRNPNGRGSLRSRAPRHHAWHGAPGQWHAGVGGLPVWEQCKAAKRRFDDGAFHQRYFAGRGWISAAGRIRWGSTPASLPACSRCAPGTGTTAMPSTCTACRMRRSTSCTPAIAWSTWSTSRRRSATGFAS